MSKVPIGELRELRRRADQMLSHVGSDLRTFLNDDGLTFVRTPASIRDKRDVNVTTTCSCLMSLVLTGQLDKVYGRKNGSAKAVKAFDRLVEAPWMSSGLTENNAFSTTLVIRTLGFLCEARILDSGISAKPGTKEWEIGVGIKDDDKLRDLLNLLKNAKDEPSAFVWRSLSDKTRDLIGKWEPSSVDGISLRELEQSLTLDLQRLIAGSWICTEQDFQNVSTATRNDVATATSQYARAKANRAILKESFSEILQLRERSLVDIILDMSKSIDNFRINEYPPTAAVVYWFVDGITRANIDLQDKGWSDLCSWAAHEFNEQQSLVESDHAAMMDPVAMAMAACLCARLRTTAAKSHTALLEHLPTQIELTHSINILFAKETNGIWPKYFPLFHYQEAGSNFCFAFELLEAVLVEFGTTATDLLDSEFIVSRLYKAVEWCQKNLLRTNFKGKTFVGWNSGGSIETLKKAQPESWATAVVHMFLWELSEMLSSKIQQRLLEDYQATPGGTLRSFDQMVDIEIPLETPQITIKNVCAKMIKGIPKGETAGREIRKSPIESPHSALFFGPPGTSKTDLAKGVAHGLDWPLIQIDPSHFLRANLGQIYVEAEKIFGDLMDLSGVVVLFDEMDALVQTRDSTEKLDTAAQFLTTFMLPKLTKLHDKGRVVFFMATNFQERFDEAIKRRGRFDLLLCVGPPSLAAKTDNFHLFVKDECKAEDAKAAATLLMSRAHSTPRIETQLELYTFAEFKGFVRNLGESIDTITQTLQGMKPEEFAKMVDKDSESATLRLKEIQHTSYWPPGDTIQELRRAKIDREKLHQKKVPLTQITRYSLDCRESRIPDELRGP